MDRELLSAWTVWALSGCWALQHFVRLFNVCFVHGVAYSAYTLSLRCSRRTCLLFQCDLRFSQLQMVHLQNKGRLSERVGTVHCRLRRHDSDRDSVVACNGVCRSASHTGRQVSTVRSWSNFDGLNFHIGLLRAQKLHIRSPQSLESIQPSSWIDLMGDVTPSQVQIFRFKSWVSPT